MSFDGFPKQCVKFYKELAKNNSKTWFDKHRNDYDNFVLNPARDFVSEMGNHLQKISPGIHADPRVNKSLFKIFRDVRFSKDKRPLKTNLGIWFWQGEGKRFDYSGFYFHMEPPNLMLAGGIHIFDSSRQKFFRDQVVHETHGPAMIKAIKRVEKAGYQVGGKHYKKIPASYDNNHKNAEYLLYNGLFASHTLKIPSEFYSTDLVKLAFKAYKAMNPVHQWLVEMTERASA